MNIELHCEIWECRRVEHDATDGGDQHDEGEGEDDPQQRYMTRPDQDVGERLVLQPVSGNGRGRKVKRTAETRHGAKERSTNLTALRLIARQGAEEQSQLEE